MRILADTGPLYAGPLTGIGYYTKELLDNLAIQPNLELEGFAFNFNGHKKIDSPYMINEQRILPGKVLSLPRYVGIDLPLSLFFKNRSYDLVLGTNYLMPPTGRIPNIVTVHDMCFLDHPEWVQGKNAYVLKKMLPKTLERSSGLITISNFSAERIKRLYGYEKPILVTSIPPKKSSIKEKKPGSLPISFNNSFFLFVSTIEPRKNLTTLLDAFEHLSTDIQKTHPLIVAGKPGWDRVSMNRLGGNQNKNIIYLDYVSEAERNWLYHNALATIIPSHYEGFGMMSLESINLGTPIITSDIPPQREILGNSGLFFNPKDTNKLSEYMLKMTNDAYSSKILDNQKRVLKNFSWEENAKKIADFCMKVASKP